MSLPPNVLRTADVAVEPWSLPGPFGVARLPLQGAGDEGTLGAGIYTLQPGDRSCPLHSHRFEEEHFFVLDGTLTVRELAPGAADYREFEVHAGELVAYPPNTGLAHGFYNRSGSPVRWLAVSNDQWGEVCHYPDSGKTLLRPFQKTGVFGGSSTEVLPAARTVAAARGVSRLTDAERPPHVVSPSRLQERDLGGPWGLALARSGGATAVFVNRDRLPPGTRTGPLHAHTADEERLLVLAGRPVLRQLRGTLDGRVMRFEGGVREEVALQPGDAVRWAAGDAVAHQVVNPPDASDDAVVLVIGTDRPDDLCLFPEEGTVHVRALGRTDTFERLEYFDGECEGGGSWPE